MPSFTGFRRWATKEGEERLSLIVRYVNETKLHAAKRGYLLLNGPNHYERSERAFLRRTNPVLTRLHSSQRTAHSIAVWIRIVRLIAVARSAISVSIGPVSVGAANPKVKAAKIMVMVIPIVRGAVVVRPIMVPCVIVPRVGARRVVPHGSVRSVSTMATATRLRQRRQCCNCQDRKR